MGTLIDTHCHLDASRFDPDRPDVLTRAWAAGLHGIVIPAVGPDTWEPLLELPTFATSRATGAFLNARTRPGVLKQLVLVRLKPRPPQASR